MKKKTAKKSMAKSVSKPAVKRIPVQPLGDRVLVRPVTLEEKNNTKHYGIILPESMKEEKSSEARVIAVGEGRYVDGKLVPVRVKPGDTVLYNKYSYDEVTVDGEELYIIKEEHILAVINK